MGVVAALAVALCVSAGAAELGRGLVRRARPRLEKAAARVSTRLSTGVRDGQQEPHLGTRRGYRSIGS